MDNLPRPLYLDKIIPYIDKKLIKVLTGQRRVGKSYLMKSVESVIRQMNPTANCITINLEEFAFSHIKDADGLNNEISERLSNTAKNYIFIDEIQEIEGFEKVVRSLSLNPANDIYVTGSNSTMLSSEIGSRLAGRSIEIRVHPLSYPEFLSFHSMVDSDESLDLYLRFGGMPYLRNLPDRSTWIEYLSGLCDAIIYRDIVARNSVRNNDFLQRLVMYLAGNIGQLFTAKKIADYIKSQRVSGTVTGVQTYVQYLCDAYIVNKAMRWDIVGKKHFEIGEKYFFEDLGLRNSIIGYRPTDISGLMENAVYNKLRSDNFDVKIGTLPGGKEIDFVAEKNNERKYVQVALHIDSAATAERELGNLLEVPDNYEKVLVTLRDSAPNSHYGVKMLSLREFLLS